MIRKPTDITPESFPAPLRCFATGCRIYDSSSSPNARVWLLDQDGGFYLKSSAKGSLETEAAMAAHFHKLGFGAEVLAFYQDEQDWLVTQRLEGEDCLDKCYLENPKRLCDITAELLRQLHEVSSADCPINRRDTYVRQAHENARLNRCDTSLFPDNWGFVSAEEARSVMEETAHCLSCDTLVHGDYCLPNIILQDWRLSGFIDLGQAGLGDRHIDLHWGIWSLGFNLKTDKYRERFLDAYGRDVLNPWLLEAIGAFEVFL